MAVPRQPQSLNSFLRAVRSCKPNTYRSIRAPPPSRSELHTTSYRPQTTYPNRYGPAATEGLPPPPKPSGLLASKKEEPKPAGNQQSQPQAQPLQSSAQQESKQKQEVLEAEIVEKENRNAQSSETPSPLEQAAAAVQAREPSQPAEHSLPPEEDPEVPLGNKELDIVLSIPAPSELQNGKPRHPHLEPSPYEHHFDTYSLVQELAKDIDTFSDHQAITVMKAVRLMLSINLDLAKEGLVSKSDVENESYLFRAACSELRTTMQMTRATENQKQRTQRAQLQHEFDILNQKVTQDMQTLREELKGMFNDRKMGMQEEKQKLDSQISELHYKITVLLNSEAKSEVEGLRWVLTRRAAMAIITAACKSPIIKHISFFNTNAPIVMTLSALQYYSIKSREMAEIEKKRSAAQKAQEERMLAESQGRYTTPSRSSGTQTDGGYEESLG